MKAEYGISSFYPKIQGFSGTDFSSGDIIRIEGANFSPLPAYNSVSINGKECEIISASTQRIRFLVPEEAMSGQVMIAVNGRETLSEETLCINVAQPSIVESVNAEGFVVLTSSESNGNIWLLNGEPIEGADQHQYTPETEGVYTLQIQSGNCFSEFSEAYDLNCDDLERPVISESLDEENRVILTVNNMPGNQWLLDGTAIEGAREPTLVPEVDGAYTVQYDKGICPSALSEEYLSKKFSAQLR